MTRRALTMTLTLAVLAFTAGCLDPAVRDAKAGTKDLGAKLAANDWKGAGQMMDSTFVWTKADGKVVKPVGNPRGAWLTWVKTTGTTAIEIHINDANKSDASNVVVNVQFQIRTGDQTKPANTFWTSAIAWKKTGEVWKIVSIKDLSAQVVKTGH